MMYIIELCKSIKEILISVLLFFFIYYLINIGNKYVDVKNKFIIKKRNIALSLIVSVLLVVAYSITNNKSLLSEIISLIFYSIIISYVLNPIVNYMEKRGIKRNVGIIILFIFIILAFIFIALAIIPKLSRELDNLTRLIPTYINDIYKVFDSFYLKYVDKMDKLPPAFNSVHSVFEENLNKVELYILKLLRKNTELAIDLIRNSFKLIIVPIISFYLLKDKEYFKKKLYMIAPSKYRLNAVKLCKEVDSSLIRFLKGQIITSILVGVLSIIGLLILNIKFAFLIGLTIAIFEIIPYLGPFIGITLAIVFGLTESLSKAVWGVVVLLIVQQLENNIIAPRIVGESVGLHPIVIIIVVIIGGGYFGLIGMILAIPVASVIKILSSFALDKISEK